MLTIVVRVRIVPTAIVVGGIAGAVYLYMLRNKSIKEKNEHPS